MPCFSPLSGYRARVPNANGRRPIVFNKQSASLDEPIDLPCGRCIGCRLERSRQWAVRCLHEASLYEDNCFITLTYSPDHLPRDGSLDLKHFQDFMKRLRKRFSGFSVVYDKDGKPTYPIRFFHCGEYGEKNSRPHYHACLFNFDFKDKIKWSVSNSNPLYISESLSELWPFGFATIGEVTFDSAAYVARYVTKKITGDAADSHYLRMDPVSGELYSLKPEYITMSRRPGIASGWYDKWSSDIYPSDTVVVNGRACKPPKFYDRRLELDDSKDFDLIKRMRELKAKKLGGDLGAARYAALAHHKKLVLNQQLKRRYENET